MNTIIKIFIALMFILQCWGMEDGTTIQIKGLFGSTKQMIWSGWRSDEIGRSNSTKLTKLDLTKVQFITMVPEGEKFVKYKEWLRRVDESKYLHLGANTFLNIWQNRNLIPDSWKYDENGNIRYITFSGTILRSGLNYPYVIVLHWDGVSWRSYVESADHDRFSYSVSAVILE